MSNDTCTCGCSTAEKPDESTCDCGCGDRQKSEVGDSR